MSVKKYSLKADGNTSLSEHFKVKEFASNVAGKIDSDEILIDDTLITKLEELMIRLNSCKAIITSGYRTKACDKAVGGSGVGTHTLGKACDIIFYDCNNQVIDTKLVSCRAQDVGFTGIARISNNATHLDVRTNSKYYGDEMMGHTNTVTSDFYSYYGIAKEKTDVEKAIDKLANKNIINNKEYWLEHINDVKYLDTLIVKVANNL